MLYWLLAPLKEYSILFNPFGYYTVRIALAGITAMLISFLLGPWVIKMLKKYQLGEEISPHGPESHQNKKGTPSMGGILIIASTLVPTLLWADLSNTHVLIAMSTMFLFGILGFWDDYLKIKKHKSRGMIIRHKFIFQVLLAGILGFVLVYLGFQGKAYLPWIMLILVSSSNSVNLADGLDGLAIGLTLISAGAFTALAYLAGRADFSGYLNIFYVPQASELTIFVGAMTGACLGFLWFNSHPAQVFMGDVGALSLGGSIGVIAILIKQEFLLFMVAGVFILEALSVLLQVSYFRVTGGKRIFKMAPLHHHFELLGWSEEKIVVRFWILSIIFALFSLATLKLR